MTTILELDSRVTRLEELIRNDLSVRVGAMNWAIGQAYKNTEVTRLDVAGLRVDLAHLQTSVHGDITKLTTSLNLRTSELRHDLSDAEVSIRHDMRTFRDSVMQRFEAVDERFGGIERQLGDLAKWALGVDERFGDVDKRFDGIDARLDTMDRRFDGVDARLGELLAAVQRGNGED
jgi:hypothetical protein